MKVAELDGPLLNYWVAVAEGYADGNGPITRGVEYGEAFQPSTNWAQGGPIIERERITVQYVDFGASQPRWGASKDRFLNSEYAGDTPLIAAMRCYVAGKFGDEVLGRLTQK